MGPNPGAIGGFHFEDSSSLDPEQLREKIALTGQGSMVGLRRRLGFIPFVPAVGAHPFDPTEMARDVARLRHYYARSGFPKADVAYQAKYHAKSDVVDVTIESPKARADGGHGHVRGRGRHPLVPDSLGRDWRRFTRTELRRVKRAARTSASHWPTAPSWFGPTAIRSPARPPSPGRARPTAPTSPSGGARPASQGACHPHDRQADGSPAEIVRQLPVRAGDWFDAKALEQGRQQLAQMDLVRLAAVDVPKDSATDTSVVVLLRLAENPEHLLKGEAGFISYGGLTTQGTWTDRSWLGGLRTLSVSATAQTGVGALESPAQQLYRLNLTAFQPYVGDRRLSAAGGPFVEYRSDLRDRSWAVGFEGSLAWTPAPLRSVTLSYSISHRYVYDYGLGADPAGGYLPLLNLAGTAMGSLDRNQNRACSRSGSYGRPTGSPTPEGATSSGRASPPRSPASAPASTRSWISARRRTCR